MEKTDSQSFKDRILSEMRTEHEDSLERNFDLAKSYIRITSTGKVQVLAESTMPNPQRVALYLVGKLYARKADVAADDFVTNKELQEELSLPPGSVNSAVKELRDAGILRTENRGRESAHRVNTSRIEALLKQVSRNKEAEADA
jgi:biotin operon repressor